MIVQIEHRSQSTEQRVIVDHLKPSEEIEIGRHSVAKRSIKQELLSHPI